MGCAFGRIVPEIKSSNDSNWEKGVNNVIRSRGESNLEKGESVHSFSWVVDNAIRSANNSHSKPPDNDNVSSFSLVVDNAIRSANNSDSKKPNIVRSFSLVVDDAIRSRKSSQETPPRDPELAAGAVLFPPRELPVMTASVSTVSSENFTSRRFVFEASKVKALKKRIGEGCVFEPSRVEVVLALIWKCALSASGSEATSFERSVLFQAVNLRPRMEPAVADGAVGNFVWPFAVTVEEEAHLELHVMVKRMRESMKEFVESKAKRFSEDGAFEAVMESLKERDEVLKQKSVVYKCSSWCKFPLLEIDFGWGEAVWGCSVNKICSNTIALMDTRDGGVEAFVTLDHKHMLLFQHHHHLLQYALLNPPVNHHI